MRTWPARLLGLLLVLLGAWGGLVAYAGPRYHFRMGTGAAWQWTTERWQLHAAPGTAVVLGGLLLMVAAPRAAARLGAVLALLGGAWFVVGPVLSPIWLRTISEGQAASTTLRQAAHPLGYHYGTGLLIVAAAAYAWAACVGSAREPADPGISAPHASATASPPTISEASAAIASGAWRTAAEAPRQPPVTNARPTGYGPAGPNRPGPTGPRPDYRRPY